jgi:tetratricopeptide (TPR) repeat protein
MVRRIVVAIGLAASFIATIFVAGLGLRAIHAQSSVPAEAVSSSRLVALVAGGALPEDIEARLSRFGVSFQPDAAYRATLRSAGASDKVLAALDSAKVVPPPANTQPAPAKAVDAKALQSLATAGPLITQKEYDDAARAVNAAYSAGVPSSDCAFVMGEAARQRQDFPQSAGVYEKLLEDTPNFPEAEVKLSFVTYRIGDQQEALRLAKSALVSGAGGAEAHKNAGLALEAMRKVEAARQEYDAALTIKPDYMAAIYDVANLSRETGDLNAAVTYYKRAIALDANYADAHHNLGIAYEQLGQLDSAIHEFREAKRLNPQELDTRNELARALLHHGDFHESVVEFKALVDMNPGSALCHDCYGTALFDVWDFDGAEAQFKTALQIDPSDAPAHLGLGGIREEQKRYDEALTEYKTATSLDPSLADPYTGAGRVLIAQQKYSEAVVVLKEGVAQRPDSAKLHELLAQAMAGTGDKSASAAAIDEGKASVALDPNNLQTILHLASDYEKSGDWVNAMVEYRKASLTAASQDVRGKVYRRDETPEKVQQAYDDAQKRFQTHLNALRAAGKSDEAAALDAKLKAASAAPGLADQVDEAMKAGAADDKVRNFSQAVIDFKHAVELADKMQPHDARLVTALEKLGNNEMGQDNDAAKAAYSREYKAACELFGTNSGSAMQALQSLGRFETFTHDYASAEHHYFQAVDIATHNFGEGSDEAAKATMAAASVYVAQKDYAKAEPYVLRAVHSEESIQGPDSMDLIVPLSQECYLYDQWGKSKESDACDQRMIALVEKQYGKNSPAMVPILMSDAKALRALGRNTDAEAMEQRVAQIRSTSMQPN